MDDDEQISDDDLEFLVATCASYGSQDVATPNQDWLASTLEEQQRTIKRLQLKISRHKKKNEKLTIEEMKKTTSGLVTRDIDEMKHIKQGSQERDVWCSFMNDQVLTILK